MNRKAILLTPEARQCQIVYWEEGARQDLETSVAIFEDAKRYGPALFFLHLSIEKILKALFVAKRNEFAPLTHNLLALVEFCDLDLDDDKEQTLATINEFNMVTRYPSQKSDFYKSTGRDYAETFINRGKDIFKWIDDSLQNSR